MTFKKENQSASIGVHLKENLHGGEDGRKYVVRFEFSDLGKISLHANEKTFSNTSKLSMGPQSIMQLKCMFSEDLHSIS